MIDARAAAMIGLIAPVVLASGCFEEAGVADSVAATTTGTTAGTAGTAGSPVPTDTTASTATTSSMQTSTGAQSTGVDPDSTTGDGSTSSTTETGADSSSGGGAPRQVLLYATAVEHDGNLVGGANRPDARDAANALCDEDRNKPADCFDVVAVITIDNVDAIENLSGQSGLPEGLPVFSPSANLVAQSWANMVADPPMLVSSLQDAQVTTESFWTGTDVAGGAGPTCTTWTYGGPNPPVGRRGNPTVIDNGWFSGGNNASCDSPAPLLCACW